MEQILNQASLLDTVITALIPLVIGGIASIVASYVKKGQLHDWGFAAGKSLSKFCDAKFGKARWEKLEDSITIAFVSFAMGLKDGADYDDNEIETLMKDKNMVGKLPKQSNNENSN